LITYAFGLSETEARNAVKKIISILDLGHPKYSVASLPPISVYDSQGELKSNDGKALMLPGFEGVRRYTAHVAQLSKELGFPVTFIDAPVLAAIEGTIF